VANQPLKTREERWREEASYFDKSVAKIDARPMDPLAVARYQGPLHRRFNKEFRLRLLGDVRGKKVLDVGCSDGTTPSCSRNLAPS
jgi:hypothetical protein